MLSLYFIISPVWILSRGFVLSINTNTECLQPAVCQQDLSNQSCFGSYIISLSDKSAQGKTVRPIEGNMVLSSLSSCWLNCFQAQHEEDYDICSVDCSTHFAFLKCVYNLTKSSRQSILDSLRLGRRYWNVIRQGIDDLLSRENWKTHIIFTSSDEDLPAISLNTNLTATKQLMFSMDEGMYLNETLGYLYTQLRENDLNFIVVCSAKCIVKFLHQVHRIETMFEKTSSWLVIPTKGCAEDIVKTGMQCPKAGVIVMDFVTRIKDCPFLSRTTLHNQLFGYNSEGSSKKDAGLAYCAEEKMVLNCSTAVANLYKLHTSKSVKKMRHIGHISQDGEVALAEEMFPGLKYGFNNRTLSVGILELPPFVIKNERNGTISYSGLCIDLLHELSRGLNFSYKFFEPEDKEWGTVVDGRWTGLIGQLAYKKVNLVATPLTIVEDREDVMDFTVPYFFPQTGIIFKKPDQLANRWMTLVSPFRYEVYICILFSFIFSTVFLFVIEEIHPENPWADSKLSSRQTRYRNILWCHFGALVANGGAYRPNSQSGRTVLACWWMFTVISAAAYSGNLVAFLTDWREKLPFSTLDEMVEQENYKWGVVGGSFYITLFQNSNLPVYKKIWQGLQSDPEMTSKDMAIHKSKVLAGQYAYLGNEVQFGQWRLENCDLIMLKDQFYLMQFGLGLPNNSAYTSLFSSKILRINELGLPRVWFKRWSSNVQCETQRSTKKVDLLALQSAFYVAGVGVLFALFVLMTEVMYKRTWRKSKSPKKENNEEASDDKQNE